MYWLEESRAGKLPYVDVMADGEVKKSFPTLQKDDPP